eukprot:6197388-Pleurochrysis_carterae.AAC.2
MRLIALPPPRQWRRNVAAQRVQRKCEAQAKHGVTANTPMLNRVSRWTSPLPVRAAATTELASMAPASATVDGAVTQTC